MKKIILLCAAAALSACAATQPDWVNGTSTQYPADRYLTGAGQADQRELAKDRARADLAKVFAVQIREASQDKSTFTSEETKGVKQKQQRIEVVRDIQISNDRMIEGMEIGQVWQDPKTLQYHALAVLPRLKAATNLRQEIERLDEGTEKYLRQAQQEDDLLSKIGFSDRAVRLQRERTYLQNGLKILDPTGIGAPPKWQSTALEADFDALLRRLRIAARVEHDEQGMLKPALEGGIAAAGFTVDTSAQPDYILTGNLALEDLGRQQGWYWLTGAVEIELKQSAGEQTRGRYRFPIKVSAQQPQLARKRARDEINAQLKNQLRDVLLVFSTRQEKK